MSVYHDRIVGDPEGNKDGTGALDADTHVHKLLLPLTKYGDASVCGGLGSLTIGAKCVMCVHSL